MNNRDVINGLRVSDFSYLLEYFSNRLITNFDDIDKLKELKESIMNRIDDELKKDITIEEMNLKVCHETAVGNLNNLKMIIEKLTEEELEK